MQSNTPHPLLLRRADQSTLAVLVLLAIGGLWIAEGGWSDRFVEADRADLHSARFQVNVNTAEMPELNQLPGIGEKLGRRIIEIRQTAGPFAEIDDLRQVGGIGPKIMERLRPYILPIPKK